MVAPCRGGERELAAAMFAAAFSKTDAPVALRTEAACDIGFLDELAAACSPLAGLLPDAVIRQQTAFQRIGHEAAFPAAMRRLVTFGGQLAGRIAIDWNIGESRCVDIAILPAMQRRGIGAALLCAWVTTAERLRVPATLSVRPDNPAIALYRRSGLVPTGDESGPMLTMARR